MLYLTVIRKFDVSIDARVFKSLRTDISVRRVRLAHLLRSFARIARGVPIGQQQTIG